MRRPGRRRSLRRNFAQNQIAFGNVKWKINKHYGFGLELMNVWTEQIAGETLTGQQFSSSYWFVFQEEIIR